MSHRTFRINKLISDEINRFVQKKLQQTNESKIESLMPRENLVIYEHGVKVGYKDSDQKERETELKSHGAKGVLPFEKIITSDDSLMADFIESMSEQMASAVSKTIFETMGDVTRESGNVVDGKGRPISHELLIEAFSKIELGVDENGEISMPQMVLSPQIAAKAEAIQKTPEYQKEFKKIYNEKAQNALKDEEKRLAKFRKPIENDNE